MAKTASAPKLSKEQILHSARYAGRRDLIGALLKDGVKYSHKEVDAAIEKYMKGKVN